MGVPAVSLGHWQPNNNYVYRLRYISIPAVGPCSTFVHLALFLCSISVLPLKVIKRLAYGIDKDRVLCEVGAGLIMNVSLRRASGIRELPDGAK